MGENAVSRIHAVLNAALRVTGSTPPGTMYVLQLVVPGRLFVYVYFHVCRRTHNTGIIPREGQHLKKKRKNY